MKSSAPSLCPITVVLLNYNGNALLTNCVQSITQNTVKPKKVFVIDNGSENFNAGLIEELLSGAKISFAINQLKENRGYVGGMNYGITQAIRENAEWLMTLSNDTELDPLFFEKLNETLLKLSENIGMLAPKIRSLSDKSMLDATGLLLALDGMSSARGQRQVDHGQFDHTQEIMIPNGVAAVYRAQTLKDTDLFDEAFESYCEDTDLGMRCWLKGWDCLFIPKCLVYHARSSTLGEFSLRKLYLVERNHYWVAVKNFPAVLLLILPITSLCRFFFQCLAVFLNKGQGKGFQSHHCLLRLILVSLRAHVDAALGSAKMLKKRFKLKKTWKRTQYEILKNIWKTRMYFSDLILK